jgi:hypothetical protein
MQAARPSPPGTELGLDLGRACPTLAPPTCVAPPPIAAPPRLLPPDAWVPRRRTGPPSAQVHRCPLRSPLPNITTGRHIPATAGAAGKARRRTPTAEAWESKKEAYGWPGRGRDRGDQEEGPYCLGSPTSSTAPSFHRQYGRRYLRHC